MNYDAENSKSSGCENATVFQMLKREKRNAALCKALKGGVSIRQASRLTGMNIDVIRRIGNG